MARKTRFTSYTARGEARRLPTSEPTISDVPQTVVQELASIRQTTQPTEDVIHVVDDAE
ncbi:MAG: hypothetical protein OXU37_05420 [Thaumarchaeota archaeon]|nr:hypothetical protein [Nitrososphaerota archaeon]